LQAVREAVIPSISPSSQPTHEDFVFKKIKAIVEARKTAAMPAVPRLEGVEVSPVEPTPVPAQIPRQRSVPSRNTVPAPAPQSPRTPLSSVSLGPCGKLLLLNSLLPPILLWKLRKAGADPQLVLA
jgi:hypothetical protein